jgi:hypothetical protein
MVGAIIGDAVGSIHEFNQIKTTDFPLLSGNTAVKWTMKLIDEFKDLLDWKKLSNTVLDWHGNL